MYTHINTYETMSASTRHTCDTPDHGLVRWAAAAMAARLAQGHGAHPQNVNQCHMIVEAYSTCRG